MNNEIVTTMVGEGRLGRGGQRREGRGGRPSKEKARTTTTRSRRRKGKFRYPAAAAAPLDQPGEIFVSPCTVTSGNFGNPAETSGSSK
jgi:hypothetical protein